jgi:hypothetical protein
MDGTGNENGIETARNSSIAETRNPDELSMEHE